MTRDGLKAKLVVFIDAARMTGKTHVSLHLQDGKLEIRSYPLRLTSVFISSYPEIKVSCSHVGCVSTREHEVPASSANSVHVAQALLDNLEENLTKPLFT